MTQYPAKICKMFYNLFNSSDIFIFSYTAATDVTIHHFGSYAIRPRFRWMMLPEEIQNAPFRVTHFSDGYTLYVLHESCEECYIDFEQEFIILIFKYHDEKK